MGSQVIGNMSQNWTQNCFVFGNTQQGLNPYKGLNWTSCTTVSSRGKFTYGMLVITVAPIHPKDRVWVPMVQLQKVTTRLYGAMAL